MSEFSGSYQRFTSDQHSPSTRPHNKFLASQVVNGALLTRHSRNLQMRDENKHARVVNARTLYDREPNDMVEGGSLKGWRNFKHGFVKGISGVAKVAEKVAPLVPLLL